MLCGAEGWDDMQLWADCRRAWLATFLDLSAGIPSADTLRRVMAALDPKAFREHFAAWAQDLVERVGGQIAIDGKAVRGSARPSEGLRCVHIVRAFLCGNKLVLGQLACDEKSNEITAIPDLLKMIALKGALVSIDAMGTQREIAEAIVDGGGDYLQSVKDNQPTLRAEIEAALGSLPEPKTASTTFTKTENEGHGRHEVRRVWTSTKLARLEACSAWPWAQTIVRIESERTTDSGVSIEDHFYISSRKLTAKQAAAAVRDHWQIESCHWTLDVTLAEDRSTVWEGHAPENLSVVRSVVMTALKREPRKLSMKQKKKLCGWDTEYLTTMLRSLFPA